MAGMFSLMDPDVQKAVFSAAALMSIFFLLCILSKFVLYGFLTISLVSTTYTGYLLFIKPKVKNDKTTISSE